MRLAHALPHSHGVGAITACFVSVLIGPAGVSGASLEFRIALPGAPAGTPPAYPIGTPIAVEAVLTNRGREAVTVARPVPGFPHFGFSVGTTRGRPVEPDGAHLTKDIGLSRGLVHKLAPGEAVSSVVDLTMYFAFAHPGSFTVVARYQVQASPTQAALGVAVAKAESNKCEVEVVKAPAGQAEAPYAALEAAKRLHRHVRLGEARQGYEEVGPGTRGPAHLSALLYLARLDQQKGDRQRAEAGFRRIVGSALKTPAEGLARYYLAEMARAATGPTTR